MVLSSWVFKHENLQNNKHHHIDGRTKPEAHTKVLPLCAGHHQDNTGQAGLIAVHPWKKRFEQRYGNQYDLLDEVMQRINNQ